MIKQEVYLVPVSTSGRLCRLASHLPGQGECPVGQGQRVVWFNRTTQYMVPKEMANILKMPDPSQYTLKPNQLFRRTSATSAVDAGAATEQLADF